MRTIIIADAPPGFNRTDPEVLLSTATPTRGPVTLLAVRMRKFLPPHGAGLDEPGEEMPEFVDEDGLVQMLAAIASGRSLSPIRESSAFVFHPRGMDQIGPVPVTIDWSVAREDYILVRLDDIVGIGMDDPSERSPAIDPVKATLGRLRREPPAHGGLL